MTFEKIYKITQEYNKILNKNKSETIQLYCMGEDIWNEAQKQLLEELSKGCYIEVNKVSVKDLHTMGDRVRDKILSLR